MDYLDSLTHAARIAEFKVVGPGHYVKYNPLLGIKTTVVLEGSGETRTMHVKHEQEVEDILDLNVAQQNDFSGYKGKELVQATRIPMIEHRKIMERCGFQAGHGYDEKVFKRLLNDSDYSKFKVVPGKI